MDLVEEIIGDAARLLIRIWITGRHCIADHAALPLVGLTDLLDDEHLLKDRDDAL
jgi:hypothetical protein